MRQQIRRLSLALKFKSSSQGIAQPAPSSESLAQFISETKAKYLDDVRAIPSRGEKWTVVMGNEAGDLDSVASSIGFAWIQSHVHNKPTIPLVQIERDDFGLRPENIYALSLTGITSPIDQLLSLTDIAPFAPFPSDSFALVDHNRINSRFSSAPESANVTAIIDHHDDEKIYLSASPRTIAQCGSCASHIALLCPPDLPQELATLLLTAILIDTNGLKLGGKAVDTDIQAVAFLAPLSTYRESLPPALLESLTGDQATGDLKKTRTDLNKARSLKELTKTLETKKKDVSALNGRDLLRRDYKEYTYVLPWAGNKEIKAGLASVAVGLKQIGKNGKLEEALGSWVQERGIEVLGVLTSFNGRKDGKGKHKREMAWVVYDAGKEEEGAEGAVLDFEELAKRLWTGLEANGDIRVKKHKKVELDREKLLKGMVGMVYKQRNAKANRKVVAPALKGILENK